MCLCIDKEEISLYMLAEFYLSSCLAATPSYVTSVVSEKHKIFDAISNHDVASYQSYSIHYTIRDPPYVRYESHFKNAT